MTRQQEQELQRCASLSIDWDDVVATIGEQFEPGDVFSAQALDDWAKENGYIKAE